MKTMKEWILYGVIFGVFVFGLFHLPKTKEKKEYKKTSYRLRKGY